MAPVALTMPYTVKSANISRRKALRVRPNIPATSKFEDSSLLCVSKEGRMIQIHNDGPANGSIEKDAALGLVSDVAQEIDPLIEKRVLRKIDIFLMPAMLIGK